MAHGQIALQILNLENNLLKRKADPQHGRILCAALTKQGEKVVKRAHTLIKEVEESMMRSLSKKNKTLFENFLVECVYNLDEAENDRASTTAI